MFSSKKENKLTTSSKTNNTAPKKHPDILIQITSTHIYCSCRDRSCGWRGKFRRSFGRCLVPRTNTSRRCDHTAAAQTGPLLCTQLCSQCESIWCVHVAFSGILSLNLRGDGIKITIHVSIEHLSHRADIEISLTRKLLSMVVKYVLLKSTAKNTLRTF